MYVLTVIRLLVLIEFTIENCPFKRWCDCSLKHTDVCPWSERPGCIYSTLTLKWNNSAFWDKQRPGSVTDMWSREFNVPLVICESNISHHCWPWNHIHPHFLLGKQDTSICPSVWRGSLAFSFFFLVLTTTWDKVHQELLATQYVWRDFDFKFGMIPFCNGWMAKP